jgi:hypothetical protein
MNKYGIDESIMMGRCLTQDFVVSKQVLYHLSQASSPFCFSYFGDRGLTFCPGWSGLQFSYFTLPTVDGMTGVFYHTQVFFALSS